MTEFSRFMRTWVDNRPPQFRFRPEKAAEAIDLIARARPGETQYFVGKLLYLADKEHLLDWGRPIVFDRYVAMEHGPVPSCVRNMLAAAADANVGLSGSRLDEAKLNAQYLLERVTVRLSVGPSGERQQVFSRDASRPFQFLSGSDIECLERVIAGHRGAGFRALRQLTHKDHAWKAAWYGKPDGAKAADIDLALWAPEEEQEAVREQLREYALFAR